MFSVVTFEKNQRKNIFIEKIFITSEIFFFKINIHPKTNYKKLQFLRNSLPEHQLEAVISESDFPLPQWVKPYCAETYRTEIFLNSFLNFLNNTQFKDRTLAFNDKNGKFASFETKFLNKFKEIFIITESSHNYIEIAEENLKKYGHTPIIKTNLSGEYFDFFVDFNTNQFKINQKNKLYNFLDFNEDGFNIPQQIETVIPQNVNRIDFCGALYENYGLETLKTICYNPVK